MRNLLRRFRRDTRGVSLAILAIIMSALLSLLALSLDLGLLYTARSEAQRAADAAALAGASAFLNYAYGDAAVRQDAQERAVRYAALNDIRGAPGEVIDTTVDVSQRQVSVTISRNEVPLWFARLFGIATSSIAATATAGAVRANRADCVAPLAFEQWEWEWGDQERVEAITPDDPLTGERRYITLPFAGVWENRPDECYSGRIAIGETQPEGPLISKSNWASRLFEDDPDAWWNPETKRIEDRDGTPAWNSPRVITVVQYDPSQNPTEITVHDFLLFFIESVDGQTEEVRGRFLAYASGSRSGQGPVGDMVLGVQLTQ